MLNLSCFDLIKMSGCEYNFLQVNLEFMCATTSLALPQSQLRRIWSSSLKPSNKIIFGYLTINLDGLRSFINLPFHRLLKRWPNLTFLPLHEGLVHYFHTSSQTFPFKIWFCWWTMWQVDKMTYYHIYHKHENKIKTFKVYFLWNCWHFIIVYSG